MTEIEMENTEPRIIKTQDENGEVYSFELLDIVNFEDKDYGLLLYVDEDEQVDEDEEVVIMKLHKEGEAFTFETIEDEDEFNKIVTYLEEEGHLEFEEDEDEEELEEETED